MAPTWTSSTGPPWWTSTSTYQCDDALGWLFDLLLKKAKDHSLAITVIDDRFDSLLRSRPDAVLRFVFDPTRDPSPEAIEAIEAIEAGLAGVQAGAPVEALEDQWHGWVRAGEFDGGIWGLPGGRSWGAALVSALGQLAPLRWSTSPQFVTVRERLTDAAVLRWNALLTSDDPADQKRGLTTLAGLLLERLTCFGRFPACCRPPCRADLGCNTHSSTDSTPRPASSLGATPRSRRRRSAAVGTSWPPASEMTVGGLATGPDLAKPSHRATSSPLDGRMAT